MPRPRPSLTFTSLALIVAIVLAACGAQTAASPDDESPAGSPAATDDGGGAEGAVSTLEDVESATIQIEAEGSFVDPEFGLVENAGGRGSGFIIDPSGIAVTNNHVVTGSALLRVFVGGEDEPLNAQVLGVSECSDLAVIDLEGDGFPFLEWYDDEVTVGTDVYAAGYPLGTPEFTLNGGIVSKDSVSFTDEDAQNWTDVELLRGWTSVERVIEHDANIQPGNSGGPLVTEDGKVLGINYAGLPGPTGTEQFYAIAHDEARPIVEQLEQGEDVESIGVNGFAINPESGYNGIWVNSVEAGSPADTTGVQGGDIIRSLQGLVLGTDGTMSDYCDILRSHDEDDTMDIEVLRFATEEVLEGQLNGRALETSFSFAQELEEEVQEQTGEEGPVGYEEYTEVTDDSGAIVMTVPTEWDEIDGTAWFVGEDEVGPGILATTSIEGWNTAWVDPGIFFGASATLRQEFDVQGLLDASDFSDECTYDTRYDYEDPLYVGAYDLYTNCGGDANTFVVLAAEPPDGAFIMLLQVVLVSEADAEALDQILNTFQVIGEL